MTMFQQKPPKSQVQELTSFTIHNPHDVPLTNRNWNQGYYQTTSIDPAKKQNNYTIRVQRRYYNGSIVPILFARFNISYVVNEQSCESISFKELHKLLDQYTEHLVGSHFIFIERQLPVNYRSLRISQDTISYIMVKIKDTPYLPLIYEIDSKLKYTGCPSGLNKYAKKQWGTGRAQEILQMRGDTFSLNIIKANRKKDDLCDTVLQEEIAMIRLNVGLPPAPPTFIIKDKGLNASMAQLNINSSPS